MYNLDSQLNFNNEEGLSKLGVWLRRKVIACESKLNEAEEVLRKCGFPEDVLQREWDAQIKAQTKPLPRELISFDIPLYELTYYASFLPFPSLRALVPTRLFHLVSSSLIHRPTQESRQVGCRRGTAIAEKS